MHKIFGNEKSVHLLQHRPKLESGNPYLHEIKSDPYIHWHFPWEDRSCSISQTEVGQNCKFGSHVSAYPDCFRHCAVKHGLNRHEQTKNVVFEQV